MSGPTGDEAAIRTLVVAPQPFRPDELVGESPASASPAVVIDASVIRRPGDLEEAIDEADPDVIVVWTASSEGRGVDAIGHARAGARPASRPAASSPAGILDLLAGPLR